MQQNPSSTDHLFLVPSNPNFPPDNHFFSNNMIINNVPNNINNFHLFNQTSSIQFPSHYDYHDHQNLQDINNIYNPSSGNNSSEEQQASMMNERKQRRMISNRESARRSRMRKQKHLDELWSQVMWLRSENHHLVDKLNRAAERHETVVRENAQLKDEAAELRAMLSDLRITASPSTSDVMACNTAYLRSSESSSNQYSNITTSMDLLG